MIAARVLSYGLTVAIYVAAIVAVLRFRRYPWLYHTVALLPWLVTALAWTLYLLARAAMGYTGNDLLATVNTWIRSIGPANLIVCILYAARYHDRLG